MFMRSSQPVDFIISYQTEGHEVDGSTFATSLFGLMTLIEEANKELDTGSVVSVRIKALPEGSFEAHLELRAAALVALHNIFTKENFESAKNILSTFVEYVKLRKEMKGDKTKDAAKDGAKDSKTPTAGGIAIQNMNGGTVIYTTAAINLTQNNRANAAFDQAARAIASDQSMDGIDIKSADKQTLVSVSRQEAKEIIDAEYTEESAIKKDIQRVYLKIVKPSFQSSLKWEFGFFGNRIHAMVRDESFNAKIASGERVVGAKDQLDVDLEITSEWDAVKEIYAPKEYIVSAVHNVVPLPSDIALIPD